VRFSLLRLMLLSSLLLPAGAMAFGFPELPFCPLGGPPGWFNRLTGQHHRRYPPPPSLRVPRAVPYGTAYRRPAVQVAHDYPVVPGVPVRYYLNP